MHRTFTRLVFSLTPALARALVVPGFSQNDRNPVPGKKAGRVETITVLQTAEDFMPNTNGYSTTPCTT